MNDIEKLEERIAQLTELVKTGTETIESLKETLKTVEKERDRLADQRTESEPRFERVEKGEMYFAINDELDVIRGIEDGYPVDNNRYKVNNYFYTKERAEEVTDKIRLLLKLERLHDIYCPDYVPDWDNISEYKYYIFYSTYDKRYGASFTTTSKHKTNVFFPTSKITQKVCDILNKELEAEKCFGKRSR